jgi:hypothetical protein
MKLDQEVRHKSEDIRDDVLLDVVKALQRRVRVINREYDIPYIAGYSKDDALRTTERVSLPIQSRFQRPGGLAPPAPGPDDSLGLPDPLGAGFLGAALEPLFVVVA